MLIQLQLGDYSGRRSKSSRGLSNLAITQTFGAETAKQGFHFVGGHPLHKPCLDFIAALRLVIKTQLLEGGSGLSFDAREGIADLVISEQRPAMTVLHDVG